MLACDKDVADLARDAAYTDRLRRRAFIEQAIRDGAKKVAREHGTLLDRNTGKARAVRGKAKKAKSRRRR